MRSDMALLKNIGAEVAQIRESMRQPNQAQPQYFTSPIPQECIPPPQCQYPQQNRWPPPGPGQRGETAQYQRGFAPQHNFSGNVLAASKMEVSIAPIATGVVVVNIFSQVAG